jgi:hypothetical protein
MLVRKSDDRSAIRRRFLSYQKDVEEKRESDKFGKLNFFGKRNDAALNVVQKLVGTAAAIAAAFMTIYVAWKQAGLQEKIVALQMEQLAIQQSVNEPLYKIKIRRLPGKGAVVGYYFENTGAPVLDATVNNYSFWSPVLICNLQGKNQIKEAQIPMNGFFSPDSDWHMGIPFDRQEVFWTGDFLSTSPWGVKSRIVQSQMQNSHVIDINVLFVIEYKNRLNRIGRQYFFGNVATMRQISNEKGLALHANFYAKSSNGNVVNFPTSEAVELLKIAKMQNLACNG